MTPIAATDTMPAAPYRELTVDELHAVAGAATTSSGGLAPDPHTPDLVKVLMALIRKLG